MSKQVVGVYETAEEAVVTVEDLRSRGYSKNDITLAANEDVRQTIPYGYEGNIEDADATSETQDQSFWEQVKDAFTFEDSGNDNMDSADHPLAGYEDQIERGSIAVLVDSDEKIDLDNPDYVGTERDDTIAQGRVNDPATGVVGDDTASGNITDETTTETNDSDKDLTEEEKIKLREERLNVDKENVQTGEVRIKKDVVEDTETVEVPTTHEEVTIERKPVDEKTTDADAGGIKEDDDEIVIPVHEEQVNVDKENVVTEEVDVERKKVTEDKQVSDKVKREELDVDAEGDVDVDKDRR